MDAAAKAAQEEAWKKRGGATGISANTIKRNDLAYPIYMEHRQPPKSRRRREPLLMRLLAAVAGGEHRAVQSKVT
jgi:hypothetical protein